MTWPRGHPYLCLASALVLSRKTSLMSKHKKHAICHVTISTISVILQLEGKSFPTYPNLPDVDSSFLARLITIMLATLRMSVQDCLEEYKRLAGSVFGHPRHLHQAGQLGVLVQRNKYATTNLENAIKDVMRRRGEVAHDHDDAMQFRTPKGLCRASVLRPIFPLFTDLTFPS